MSGIMSDADIADLVNQAVRNIVCEWPDCGEPAVVMGKGCVDARHIAVCSGHHQWIRDYFDMIPPYVVCAACAMPMLLFEGHFDIVSLR